MDFNGMFQSKRTRTLLAILGALVLLLLTFKAGELVGYRKAAFSEHWGEAYARMFGDRQGFMMPHDAGFSGAHGAAGKIIRTALPSLTLADQDGIEKNVLVTDSSIVRRFRDTVSPTDIHENDFAVVIGSPNEDGQIEARFIRLLTAPPPGFITGTSTASF